MGAGRLEASCAWQVRICDRMEEATPSTGAQPCHTRATVTASRHVVRCCGAKVVLKWHSGGSKVAQPAGMMGDGIRRTSVVLYTFVVALVWNVALDWGGQVGGGAAVERSNYSAV